MEKLISVFKKIARLLTVILLLVLAALQLVALIDDLSNGGPFMGVLSSITINLLLVLLYATPAILLLLKKDNEARVALSFILGYLFIRTVIDLIGFGVLINQNAEALVVIYSIVSFILGLAYGFVLICFLLEKIFKIKLMKLGFLVLVASLVLIFILIILEIVLAIDAGWTFTMYLQNFSANIIIPLVMLFGLMLLEE